MGASLSAGDSPPEKSIHEFTVKVPHFSHLAYTSSQELNLNPLSVLPICRIADVTMWTSAFTRAKCFSSSIGLTNSNYTQLTELYNKYKDKGFEILAFPCNQFLKQEPGTSEAAQDFACTRFKAEYPIFQKVKVNGADAAPVYKFLKSSKGGFCGSSIKWNFTKFLVDKEGIVIKRFGSTTQPLAIEHCFGIKVILLISIFCYEVMQSRSQDSASNREDEIRTVQKPIVQPNQEQ
nr:probable glutathione peroxidase 5 [Ipomoea batatas]